MLAIFPTPYVNQRDDVELTTFEKPVEPNLNPPEKASQRDAKDENQDKTWKKTAQVAVGKTNPTPKEVGRTAKQTPPPPQVAIPRGPAPIYPIYFPARSFILPNM